MAAVTLKRLAEELNLSVSTVSRALNKSTSVKTETRELVMEAVKRNNYVPNEIARSLKKASTNTVAVVLPDISETFFGVIVNEIDRVLAREGYMILLTDTHEQVEKETKHLDMLFMRRVDAVVLATVDCTGSTVSRFMDSEVPVVFIDNVPEIASADSVTIDNYKASKLAVDHLAAHGHRQIAMISGSEWETTGSQRLAGFREAMRDQKIPVDEALILRGDYKSQSAYQCMKQLLQRRSERPFTAVYVVSEKMTYGAVAAIEESGLRIPEDISVVGFDVHQVGMEPKRRITSVRQPETDIGREAANLLLQSLGGDARDGEGPGHRRLLLQPFLEEGETVKKI